MSGLNKFWVLGLALLSASPVLAILPEGNPEPAELQHPTVAAGLSLRQANALAGKAAQGVATLDAQGTTVRAVEGKLTAPSKAGAEEIARSLVTRSLVAPGPKAQGKRVEFAVSDVKKSEGESHVRLVQKVEGLEVFGPDLLVHVGQDGAVTMVNGTAIETPRIVNASRITAEAAVAAAKKTLGEAKASAPARVLFPAAEGLRHAWKLDLTSPGHEWLVAVDAETSEILLASDQVRHLTGTGSIYERSPLHGGVITETLQNLKAGGLLLGDFADIRNEDTERAKSEERKFVYEPNDTHFDEAMVYYHLDKVHAYYKQQLGFKDLDKPMVATVHVGDGYDNAYFSPQSGQLAFGDGTRLNDLAKDDTVAYHEYTHAVTNAICGMMFGGEGGGMHEGYSDYFAGTLTNDPVIGAYAAQRLPSGNIRNMDNELHYPEDSGSEPHKAGRIWGGACWDVREALGPAVADRLVHDSRYYLPKFRPMFADGYKGLLKADQKYFQGKNAAKITEIFTKRGIAKAGMELSFTQLLDKANFSEIEKKTK